MYLYKLVLSFIFAVMVLWYILIWPYTRITEEIRYRKQLNSKKNGE